MYLPVDLLSVCLGATGAFASSFVGLGTYQANPSKEISQKKALLGLLYIHAPLPFVIYL